MTDNRKTLDRTSYGAVLNSCMVGNAYDAKAVDGNIAYISGTGRKLDGTIHGTALACIYLSMPHADGGHLAHERAVKLMNAMPRGARAKALAAWFAAFSNIRVKFDTKAGVWAGGLLGLNVKGYAPARPADAALAPFWSAPEKDVDPADFTTDTFVKRVKSLLAAATADNAKLDDKGRAALADLTALAGKLAAVVPAAAPVAAVDPLELVS